MRLRRSCLARILSLIHWTLEEIHANSNSRHIILQLPVHLLAFEQMTLNDSEGLMRDIKKLTSQIIFWESTRNLCSWFIYSLFLEVENRRIYCVIKKTCLKCNYTLMYEQYHLWTTQGTDDIWNCSFWVVKAQSDE